MPIRYMYDEYKVLFNEWIFTVKAAPKKLIYIVKPACNDELS